MKIEIFFVIGTIVFVALCAYSAKTTQNRAMEVCQVQKTYMIDGTIYKCPN